ncbi:MAG: AraC family transcriptional regulator [Bryobacteraceae bacterium]
MPQVVHYREIRPSVRLRPFIDSFWTLQHDGEDAAPQRAVPDGHPELILNFEGPLLMRSNGPAKRLGIRFHPHGAARMLAHPMHELSGRFTPVEDLSPALSRNLDRALESAEPITAVEAALLSTENTSANGDLIVAQAVRRIILDQGASDLAALARDLGVSVRQLERRFQAGVGLPPKLFCRMQRFNNVFRVLGQESCNWVDTAVACGYYDQAHLIRDCKSLSGNTPAILLAEDADLARHFLLRFGVSHSYKTVRRGSV